MVQTNRQFQRFGLITIVALLTNGFQGGVTAASPNEAHITRIDGHVQLVHANAAVGPASVNGIVDEGASLQTGASSRAELTFADDTVVRLAANTAFGFKDGTHDLNLGDGAVLIEAPKNADGATVHAASVVAAITGTTVMIEHHHGVCKFLVLEGTGRLYRPHHVGDSVLVSSGQMVIGNPDKAVSDPVDFDIARFVRTSRFLVGLPLLRSDKLIVAESEKQQREKSKKSLVETNLVIFGGGTRVSLVGQAQTKSTAQTANSSQ